MKIIQHYLLYENINDDYICYCILSNCVLKCLGYSIIYILLSYYLTQSQSTIIIMLSTENKIANIKTPLLSRSVNLFQDVKFDKLLIGKYID